MPHHFRPYPPDQPLLLPPDLSAGAKAPAPPGRPSGVSNP